VLHFDEDRTDVTPVGCSSELRREMSLERDLGVERLPSFLLLRSMAFHLLFRFGRLVYIREQRQDQDSVARI